MQPDIAGVILGILKKNDLDPGTGSLELELTESMIMNNMEVMIATLNRLREINLF